MPVPSVEMPATERCSVLGTLALVGDFWTLGVLRCAMFGIRRFGGFQAELGVASNVLSDRLARLVDAGILARTRYQDRPPRHDYQLTDIGQELRPVILALKTWGDRHIQEAGPRTMIHHQGCESPLEVVARCPTCGAVPSAGDIEILHHGSA
jgi:DNA-binding HxlR family transcriptional regulator